MCIYFLFNIVLKQLTHYLGVNAAGPSLSISIIDCFFPLQFFVLLKTISALALFYLFVCCYYADLSSRQCSKIFILQSAS